jgi:hypothetical protein
LEPTEHRRDDHMQRRHSRSLRQRASELSLRLKLAATYVTTSGRYPLSVTVSGLHQPPTRSSRSSVFSGKRGATRGVEPVTSWFVA